MEKVWAKKTTKYKDKSTQAHTATSELNSVYSGNISFLGTSRPSKQLL